MTIRAWRCFCPCCCLDRVDDGDCTCKRRYSERDPYFDTLEGLRALAKALNRDDLLLRLNQVAEEIHSEMKSELASDKAQT